jgi:hypothetical protein
MINPLQFGLDVLSGDNVAVRKMPEIKFNPGLKTPFQRYLIDSPGAFTLVHRGRKMPRRIQMRPVVHGKANLFNCPTFTVWQILR